MTRHAIIIHITNCCILVYWFAIGVKKVMSRQLSVANVASVLSVTSQLSVASVANVARVLSLASVASAANVTSVLKQAYQG